VSSHHIVREKQEPALLILGMSTFDQELLGQLLEWSPTVIATTEIAEQLNSLGIKVDRIISDHQTDVIQSDVKYISLNGIAPIQSAMQFLLTEKYAAVNIVVDVLNLTDFEPFVPHINLVLLNQHQKTYPVTSGFTKWLPAGEIITMHDEPENLTVTGLSNVDNRFTTIQDGVVKLKFSNSFVFISEGI
jgi:thiamine pyrophosphokinase